MKIKKILFSFIIINIIIIGCVYEPPPVIYTFSIINNTNKILYIESETIEDSYLNYDTLKVGQEFKRKIIKMQCYDDYYKDTLVAAFFKELKISVSEKRIYVDPFKRNNWKEKLVLKGGNCKYGNANHKMVINNQNIIE